MGAQLPARWPGRSERLISMPDGTMDRLKGPVVGQLQRRVRWPRALWRKLLLKLKLFDVGCGKKQLRQCRI